MEYMLEKFSLNEITGLDISQNMVTRAKERWQDSRANFVVYDGFKIPFADNYFNTILSVATIQHIEKHIAFLLFRELYRVLAPGGHAVLHFLSVHMIPHNKRRTYDEECWNHIKNKVDVHWNHYYSYEELYVLFSVIIGVDDFDICRVDNGYYVHFSKNTGRKLIREELLKIADPEKVDSKNK